MAGIEARTAGQGRHGAKRWVVPLLLATLLGASGPAVGAFGQGAMHVGEVRESAPASSPTGTRAASPSVASEALPTAAPVHPDGANATPPSLVSTFELANLTSYPGAAAPVQGSGAAGIAFDNRTNLIFVANAYSDTVGVVSATTGSTVAEISVGVEPVAVAYDPDRGTVFVAQDDSLRVRVLSAATDQVVALVPVPRGADAIAYDNATDEMYVATDDPGSDNGSVLAIAGSNDSVVANISVGDFPDGVAYDPVDQRLFVANGNYPYGLGTVTVISTVSNAVVGTVEVGPDPEGVAYDPALGEVFVANDGSRTVSVLSADSLSSLGTLDLPLAPSTLAFDNASGLLFVGGPGTEGVLGLAPANGTVMLRVPLSEIPTGLVVDPANGSLAVGGYSSFCTDAGCAPSEVALLNATTGTLLEAAFLATVPSDLVYDMGAHELFVAEPAFDDVQVFSTPSLALLATVTLPSPPLALAYDAALGQVFVSDSDAAGASVVYGISDVNWTIVTTIVLPSYGGFEEFGAMVFDPVDNELFLSNEDGTSVWLVSLDNDSYAGDVQLYGYPGPLVYDPANDEVLAAILSTNCLYVCGGLASIAAANASLLEENGATADITSLALDPASGVVYASEATGAAEEFVVQSLQPVGEIPGLAGAGPVLFDPATDLVYFGSYYGEISVVAGGSTVVVATVAVPGGAEGGFALDPADGELFATNPSVGTLSVLDPGSGSYAPFYVVTFTEVGPAYWYDWQLLFDGQQDYVPGLAASFALPNGSYPYVILLESGWTTSATKGVAAAGVVTVNGRDATLNVSFVRAKTYHLTFSEQGAVNGGVWCVVVVAQFCTQARSFVLGAAGPGTYTYQVETYGNETVTATLNGQALPLSGTLALTSRSLTVHLSYRILFPVTLTETGLPTGTNWSVTIDKVTYTTNASQLTLQLPNGRYPISVASVAGYRAHLRPAVVIVRGQGTSAEIRFTALA